MMVLKVFLFLAALVLVSSATVQQEQAEQQCVSRAEFDSWWNTTLIILHRVVPKNQALLQVTIPDQMKNVKDELLNNLDNVEDKLKYIRDRMEQQQDKSNRLLDELATLRNTTMDALTDLQHQIKQQQNKTDREMAALKNTIKDGQDNLQDKVDTLQVKVVNLQDKLDTFQNTTEASTRKHHHEVVELLQNNTSCSLNGTTELQKQLENITEGLQVQLQTCNRTDVSIQYLPASCSEIAELNPHSPSGYYKINTTSGVVYCDMERHCCGSKGGWMRAAYLDMTDPTHHCPTGFRLTSRSKRSCERITKPGCTSLTFPVQSAKYSKVCGKVIGYQYASPNGFYPYYHNRARTLDGHYVDGVSITHGRPRRHIWTFAGALEEQRSDDHACPCTESDRTYTGVVPPFLGNDYFCDTGSHNYWPPRFHPDNPLWDGRGCGPTSSCCSFNSPPWFCKELPQSTTDDIEVRVCTDEPASDEDITIEAVELYVQ